MAYTEFKMLPERIRERLAEMKQTLKARKKTDDLVGFGLTVIRDRLNEDPACYLTYWPYWWCMKDLLIRNGYKFGKNLDGEVLAAYKGPTDEETLVMCETFRDIYLDRYMKGTRRFSLDGDSDEEYVLVDSDMEKRILPEIELI